MLYENSGFEIIGVAGLLFALAAQKAAAQEDAREETRQTLQLAPNPRIEVRNVNGQVTIQTSDSDVAEIEIVRRALRPRHLKYHQVSIEHTPASLIIKGQEDRRAYRRGIQVQQQVTLRIPRRVSLVVKGVGGPVQIGEVDGPVTVERVSGQVELGPVAGPLAVEGAAGDFSAKVRRLDESGIQISNIGGRVEMRFAEALNAELTAKSIGGGLFINFPNAPALALESAVSVTARIGAGGSLISIFKVGGTVELRLRVMTQVLV